MPKKRRKNDDLVTIHVGTAGIGRMQFKAFTNDRDIDRQDGEDEGTYDTPGDALRALADRLDRAALKRGWHLWVDALREDEG